jgi:hypothetical protein
MNRMNQSDNKFHATTEPVIYEYQLQNTHASRMKISTKVFVIASLAQFNWPLNVAACPFSKTTSDDMPSDATHNSIRRRRLASLSQDETTREKLASIISEQKRTLQITGCDTNGTSYYGVTNETYENIRVGLEEMSNTISDLGDRGHFIGAIVRLAAVSPFCIFIQSTFKAY